MRKSKQPGSELEATQHDSSDPFTAAPTTVSERGYSSETRSNRPMRLANDTQRPTGPTAHESGNFCFFTEMEGSFLDPETPRNHPRFSPPLEFYETDDVLSSSDEEFHAFDDGNARHDPRIHKQQVHQMKTRNTKLYRTAYCSEMSPIQGPNSRRIHAADAEISPGHSDSVHRASCSAGHSNLPGFSHCQVYLPSQVNSRGRPRYQSSHHSSNQTNCGGVLQGHQVNSTNTRDFHSLHQAQDKDGNYTSLETIRRLSVDLQKRLEREETSLPERRNVIRDRAVTSLPPIQQLIRNTANRSRQSHPPAEQRNHQVLHAHQCGRQEACEEMKSESCRRRRVGVCKETDSCQEDRTFVRVLKKRF